MSYYKWKPSKSQRQAFAIKMQDPGEREAYEDRKRAKADKRRAGSQFDYISAGGNYVPTEFQFKDATRLLLDAKLTTGEESACQNVVYGYGCGEMVHHDYIHVVNELIRVC